MDFTQRNNCGPESRVMVCHVLVATLAPGLVTEWLGVTDEMTD